MPGDKTKKLIIYFFIPIVLFCISAFFFFSFHGYGPWGGDSIGYVASAMKFYKGEPLVFQDEFAKNLTTVFPTDKIDEILTPKRYTMLNNEGFLMNRYSVGMALILGSFGKLLGGINGISTAIPLLASFNVVGVYLLSLLILSKLKLKVFVALVASVVYGFSNLTFKYAIGEPMTETPTVFFLIISFIFLILFLNSVKKQKITVALVFLFISALAFGFNINIRSANFIFISVIALFLVYFLNLLYRKKVLDSHKNRTLIISVLVFIIGFGIAITPTLINNKNIQDQKVIGFSNSEYVGSANSGIISSSNMLDARGLKLKNFFNNQGKYRPGEGSFFVYYNDIGKRFINFPYAVFIFAIGLLFLFFKDKKALLITSLWFFTCFLFYSFWINPYDRYLIPALPAYSIIFAMGFVYLLFSVYEFLGVKRGAIIIGILATLLLVLGTYPAGMIFAKRNLNTLTYRAISENDFNKIMDLTDTIDKDNSIIFHLAPYSSYKEFGATIEAYTEIPFREIPENYTPEEIKKIVEIANKENTYIWVDNVIFPELLVQPENPITKNGITAEKITDFSFDFGYNSELYRLKAS